jgi:hypothetical protein
MFTSEAKLPAITVGEEQRDATHGYSQRGEATTKGADSNQQSNCHKKQVCG